MISAPLVEQLDRLTQLSPIELRSEWRRAYRTPPPPLTPDLLIRGIAWQLQVKMLGGLCRAAERALDQRAGLIPSKRSLDTARLKPGTRLVRSWRGTTYDVLVVEDGFLFQEQNFRSLSSIAQSITGTRWSGPRFFGLVKEAGRGGRR